MIAPADAAAPDEPIVSPLERARGVVRSHRGRYAVLLGLLTAMGGFTLDANAAGFPRMRHDLHTSPAQIQLSLTAAIIGLTAGQLVIGPISDRWGRRNPLLISLAIYVVISLMGAAVTSSGELIALRFFHGGTAAAGMVIARAVVRDVFDGADLTRFYAQLVSVTMLAPIVSPVIGSQVISLVGWRGMFVFTAVVGVVALGFAGWLIPDTAARGSGPTRLLAGFGRLLHNLPFCLYGLILGASFAGLFVYVSSSSFLLQGVYGLSPRQYGLVTAGTGLGIVFAGQLNVRLPDRFPAARRAMLCLSVSTVACAYVLTAAIEGLPLVAILPAIGIVTLCHGITWPNVMSAGMGVSGGDAGSASALLGALQFGIGGLASPLSGLFRAHQAVGTFGLMLGCIGLSAVLLAVSLRVNAASREQRSRGT